MSFSIYTGKGFRMTFANGYTLSVVFDRGTYSANRDVAPELRYHWLQQHTSLNAEIAIFTPDDSFVSLGSDEVEGWVSPDAVARIAAFVTTLAPGTTKVDLSKLLEGK